MLWRCWGCVMTGDVLNTVIVGSIASAVLGVIVAAFRAGILRTVKLGPFEFAAADHVQHHAEFSPSPAPSVLPVEAEHLAKYYGLVLGQSRISFWFSLVFASIGFLIIVAGAMMYSDGKGTTTAAYVTAGGIV